MIWLRQPLGIESDVLREGVSRAVGIGCAAAARYGVPSGEGVARSGERVERQCRRNIGRLIGHRSGSAVAVEYHGVICGYITLDNEGVGNHSIFAISREIGADIFEGSLGR